MTFKYLWRYTTVILVLIGLCVAPAFADDQELAKASQNPVAAMISLPMKNKFNFGLGNQDAFAYELELQPVYPVNLGTLNLINRFIIPIVYQEEPYEGMGAEFGLRNTTYQGFFSPAEAGDVIWGVGPAVVIPTNTADSLGNDKWAAGPAVLAALYNVKINLNSIKDASFVDSISKEVNVLEAKILQREKELLSEIKL